MEANQKYKFKIPNGQGKDWLCHIDYLLEDKIDPAIQNTLVVFRIWLKHKNRWEFIVLPAWELYLYNKENPVLQEYKI